MKSKEYTSIGGTAESFRTTHWTAIEEMVHIERIAERILFLGGEVELKAAHDVNKVHDVEKMLKMAAKMEEKSARDYNLWANECSQNADSVSRKLFDKLHCPGIV